MHHRYLAVVVWTREYMRRCVLRCLRSRSSRSPDASVAHRMITRALDVSEGCKTRHTTLRFAHALRCLVAACRAPKASVVALLGLGANGSPHHVLWRLLRPGSMMVVGTQRAAVRGTVTSATTLVVVAKRFHGYWGGGLNCVDPENIVHKSPGVFPLVATLNPTGLSPKEMC